jgi:hypothetical protein
LSFGFVIWHSIATLGLFPSGGQHETTSKRSLCVSGILGYSPLAG